MAKRKICMPELLDVLPFQCRENLLTFQYMQQQAANEEEKLQSMIRIFCYIRVLTEMKIISEAEEKELTKYFAPQFAPGQESKQKKKIIDNITAFFNAIEKPTL